MQSQRTQMTKDTPATLSYTTFCLLGAVGPQDTKWHKQQGGVDFMHSIAPKHAQQQIQSLGSNLV